MARPDDEDREEGFLGRWARRKREAQQPAAPAVVEQPNAPPPNSEPTVPAPEPKMVEPPSLDLVDKDFDLAHWLKQNVPEEWKLKALRRAWESDPAISGYLDPARDYALDWNTPGGAPGYGPLSESDNVEEMLANIFGKPPEPVPEQSEAVRNDVAVVRPSSNEVEAGDPAAPQRETGGEPAPVRLSEAEASVKSNENAAEPAPSADVVSAASQNRTEIARLRRRGGGATPL
ncbi:MAG: DUF3306 domain-containing protein [Bosea sp.]|uniref:DUF3306 domain-containing protein n=1 Tax=Bosea sp. (in: a-proteobacteria) TaxID=1871050 RepID=UPI0023A4D83F|nr:DUF3306 domain-containing protein [Bosea sp. (in: a-proteobacteria)]MCP4740499.1 DUF3306 domain-containing protein [Bosea sp. (in: a-proteobacteria)]